MESYGLGRQWKAMTLVSGFAVREGAQDENRKKSFRLMQFVIVMEIRIISANRFF